MSGQQAKLYSFSKNNRQHNRQHEVIQESSNSFTTAQKPIYLEAASNQFVSTIHSNTTTYRKRLVVPTTMRQLSQLQCQFIQDQTIDREQEHPRDASFTTYTIVARILSIEKEMNNYTVVCADGTPMTQDVILYSKEHHPAKNINCFLKPGKAVQEDSVQQLQFQPSAEEGHPYFKLWVKFSTDGRSEEVVPRWLIEKVCLVKDYNELVYHWALVMIASQHC